MLETTEDCMQNALQMLQPLCTGVGKSRSHHCHDYINSTKTYEAYLNIVTVVYEANKVGMTTLVSPNNILI
jgi:hypothetical protein